LFVLLKAVYPNKFDLIWPSEKEVNLTKRVYAKEIGKFTRDQIDEAVKYMAKLAMEGERECMEPNIMVFLRYAGELNTNKKMYQEFLPAPQESKEDREKRRQLALEKCKALKGIFE
jgi:hypothetical protein